MGLRRLTGSAIQALPRIRRVDVSTLSHRAETHETTPNPTACGFLYLIRRTPIRFTPRLFGFNIWVSPQIGVYSSVYSPPNNRRIHIIGTPQKRVPPPPLPPPLPPLCSETPPICSRRSGHPRRSQSPSGRAGRGGNGGMGTGGLGVDPKRALGCFLRFFQRPPSLVEHTHLEGLCTKTSRV